MELEEILEELTNLIENKKIKQLREFLSNINSADFPSILENVDEDKIIMIYRLLPKEKAAEVFVELDHDDQEKLINALTDTEIKNVMNEIYMDDAVDLIEEMPSNVVKRILTNTKPADRKIINELLKFPEDTAGSIMTTEFVELKENMTVEEAFKIIKKTGIEKETIYVCYVIGSSRELVGTIEIKELLIADRDVKIKDILESNVISVLTTEDKENVAKMFDKYNFVALPVVDKENRLVGIVTVDDAMDVIQDEATEDFEKMAALIPSEDTYFKTGVFKHAKSRIVWLLVLMLSAMLTGQVIESFEAAISTLPLLVAFIPMIMDTGGNCGSQTSTLIIRGLAMDEISTKDIFKAIWKELRVAIVVGIVLAAANSVRIMIQYNSVKISIVVGATLIFTVIIAKLLGCILPIIAKKLKLDPAIMAAPLITTIVDTLSVLVFFNISTFIFHI